MDREIAAVTAFGKHPGSNSSFHTTFWLIDVGAFPEFAVCTELIEIGEAVFDIVLIDIREFDRTETWSIRYQSAANTDEFDMPRCMPAPVQCTRYLTRDESKIRHKRIEQRRLPHPGLSGQHIQPVPKNPFQIFPDMLLIGEMHRIDAFIYFCDLIVLCRIIIKVLFCNDDDRLHVVGLCIGEKTVQEIEAEIRRSHAHRNEELVDVRHRRTDE